MKKITTAFILLFIICISFGGCSESNSKFENRVIIGINSDVTTFNPLFAFNMNEGNVIELIYLGLIGHGWDEDSGELTSFPLLAESWEWVDDSQSIIFDLRDDVYWSDSVKFTAEDVVFSFDLYSDPVVQSRFFGAFENYFTNPDYSIDLEKSFEILSPQKIKFNFKPGAVPSLSDIDMLILPKHIFGEINREDLATVEENFNPVGTGPYELSAWLKNQSIILKLNKNSFLAKENSVEEIVFKIIPDYNSRILQLKNQEIDFLEYIRFDDLNELKNTDYLDFALQKGRNYDYIGWNNISPEEFEEGGNIVPHKLFGNKNVRRALTHAINRELILQEFLGNYGELSSGPIAPIFKWAINKDIKPYGHDPGLSKKLLQESGWVDLDKDGVRENNGIEFTFDLNVPGGHPVRSNIAVIIQNNLRSVGINTNIVTLEPSVLVDQMFQKKLDAWISGWVVPIPILLKPFWHSDFESNVPNVASYISNEIDDLLGKLEKKNSKEELADIYKKFQEVIHEDEPVTFLFWIDNIVVFNSRMKNLEINPLGSIHYCWNWTVED
ncbi:ABC transporter substrate-binding protein [Bacteroidota bacterium]